MQTKLTKTSVRLVPHIIFAKKAAEDEIRKTKEAAAKEAKETKEAVKAAETAAKNTETKGRLKMLKELVIAGVLTMSAAAKLFGAPEDTFRKMAML